MPDSNEAADGSGNRTADSDDDEDCGSDVSFSWVS